MNKFENIDAKSVKEAVGLLQKYHQQKRSVAVVGGGSEYLQLMKDHVVEPDYLINLKTIPGLDYVKEERAGFRIGALAKLADIEEHSAIREKLLILSAAAGVAASPQIRNAGTIGGNICQRPFCWYFRSSNFNCLRKGGQVCYTVTGDGRFHAILGGGPSYIVHPSDTAPALVALGAQIKITGPAGEVDVGADAAQYLPELVGPLPRHRERRNRARAPAGDGVAFRITRDPVIGVEPRQELVNDHACIAAVGRIVDERGPQIRDDLVVGLRLPDDVVVVDGVGRLAVILQAPLRLVRGGLLRCEECLARELGRALERGVGGVGPEPAQVGVPRGGAGRRGCRLGVR